MTGTLSQDDVDLKIEVTEYALKLTKAVQEWAEGQEGAVLTVNGHQYNGTSVGTTAIVRTTIATITSKSE